MSSILRNKEGAVTVSINKWYRYLEKWLKNWIDIYQELYMINLWLKPKYDLSITNNKEQIITILIKQYHVQFAFTSNYMGMSRLHSVGKWLRWVSLHVFGLRLPRCRLTCFPLSIRDRQREEAGTSISYICNTPTVLVPWWWLFSVWLENYLRVLHLLNGYGLSTINITIVFAESANS